MKDILPDEVYHWQRIEWLLRAHFESFCYREIRTPLVEEAGLFSRAIGEATDIVNKEMYEFADRSERQLALRPEATASIARTYIEHGFAKTHGVVKWYYIGPMFRAERPQRGRQRQFHQAGVELIGSDSHYYDAEAILLLCNIMHSLGIEAWRLAVNNIGCLDDRRLITDRLRRILTKERSALCDDCTQRLQGNVLRILDCKKPECRKVIDALPEWDRWICDGCTKHFNRVIALLSCAGVTYTKEPHLVRGLDYYTKTVFEMTLPQLGAQDAVAAGGRYDALISQLGGERVGAVGFAIGLERLLLASAHFLSGETKKTPDAFLVTTSLEACDSAFILLYQLRTNGVMCDMDFEGKSLKAQMRQAGKAAARFVIILGEDEIRGGTVTVKDMGQGVQESIQQERLIPFLKERSAGEHGACQDT
ncbi:MAG: histidine--tRNA ligase [Candidatus Omnitrophica bacterium]|nr:histidine--tRNA ligase [Candidatus Omnitrophota bacterium]